MKTMRAFITGIGGFAGSHLTDLLLSKGIEVHGTTVFEGKEPNLAHCAGRVTLHQCDLASGDQVTEAIQAAKPDWVVHLAALSFVPSAEKGPQQAILSNVLGPLNLLEAIKRNCPKAKTLMISSSAVYGLVAREDLPVPESKPVNPANMYGITKASQEMLARLYHQNDKIPAVNLRPFNHVGPRQSPDFAAPNFARQIAMIEKDKQEPVIHVGDLSAERDYTDVRDIARAYYLAAQHCTPGGAYNICTGSVITMQALLDMLIAMSSAAVKVQPDPARMRPSDLPILTGDTAKFHKATGWEPSIPLEQSLKDLLEYWRERV
ncbi:MAG: GDP-mannose 4,6-dehydratase [Planctomycetota bacterium]